MWLRTRRPTHTHTYTKLYKALRSDATNYKLNFISWFPTLTEKKVTAHRTNKGFTRLLDFCLATQAYYFYFS